MVPLEGGFPSYKTKNLIVNFLNFYYQNTLNVKPFVPMAQRARSLYTTDQVDSNVRFLEENTS